MRRALWGVAFAMLASAAPAQPPEPADWLDRMVQAGSELHYGGTVVYMGGQAFTALRLVHVGAPDGPLDRVQALDGAYWELRRNPLGANLLVPKDAPAGVITCPFGGNFSAEVPRRLQGVRGLYRLVESGKSRVAGRVVQQLDAMPADPYRYGLRLAVDEASGLLLRVGLIGADGQTTEQALYSLVEIMDTPEARTHGKTIATAAVPADLHAYPLTADLTQSRWDARWLPPGFTLREHSIHTRDLAQVEHLLYSDGISSLSVFVEPADSAGERLEGPAQSGRTGAFGAVVTGHQITVMGTVPELTLRMVSQNISPGAPARAALPAVHSRQ